MRGLLPMDDFVTRMRAAHRARVDAAAVQRFLGAI